MNKSNLFLLILALVCGAQAADVILGRYSDLTWGGSGTDRIASFAAATTTSTTTTTLQPGIGCNKTLISVSVYVGNNAADETYTLRNTNGYESMAWTVTENTSWFSVSPTSGSSTGELDTVTVSFAVDGLDVGVYSGIITNSATGATGSPKKVTVSAAIKEE